MKLIVIRIELGVIWVIVDRLTQPAHFLLVQKSNKTKRLAWIYIEEIMRLHEITVSTISDRDNGISSRL